MPDKYRSGCSEPPIGLSTGSPIKKLEKLPKELRYPVLRDSVICGCEGDRKPGRKWEEEEKQETKKMVPIKVSFIRLRCLVLKHTPWGIGRGRGGILQRTKKWASADMRAKVRCQTAGTLHFISGTYILLDSLRCQAGLRCNSCPWMAWEFRKR